MQTVPSYPVTIRALAAVLTGGLVSAQEKVTFQDHIRPIFENRCTNCHNPDKKKGDLDLSTFAGVMAGGSGGASVEAGDSGASTLWKVVTHEAEPAMPPKGDKIPQAEIDLIAKWITGGLLDSPDSSAKVKKKASFAMSAVASNQRPEGPPPMPEHLLPEPVVVPVRPNAVVALAHSPWAPLVAVAAPRQVLLYHSTQGTLLGVLAFPDGGTPETLSFSRNGALLLAGGGIPGKEGAVVVWDVRNGQQVIHLKLKEDFDTVLAADITADLSKVAMGGPGRRVRIFDTRTAQVLANIKKHTDWVTALAFSPDGVLLASGDRNGGLYVWEAGSGNEFHTLRGHEKMITTVAWRGDSDLVAAGSEDGNLTWWEMANGTQVKKIGSHGGVLTLNFSGDGRLVSGGRDGHVRIWDGKGAQQKDWVPEGGNPVLEAVFTDDGKRVVTGTWAGGIHSWDPEQKDAQPVALPGAPPTIDTRLAELGSRTAACAESTRSATATAADRQKASAVKASEWEALQKKRTGLDESLKALAEASGKLKADVTASEANEVSLRQQLQAAEQKATEAKAARTAAAAAPASAVSRDAGTTVSTLAAPAPPPATPNCGAAGTAADASEKEVVALRQSLAACASVLETQRADLAKSMQQTAEANAQMESMQKEASELEKAVAAAAEQAAAAAAALAKAQAIEAESKAELFRWETARFLKKALALKADAQRAQEALAAAQEKLKVEVLPTPADGSIAPASAPIDPAIPAVDVASLERQSTEANQAADAAWKEYLNRLPKEPVK